MTLKLYKNGADPKNVREVISRYINEGSENELVITMARAIVDSSTDDPISAIYNYTKGNITYVADPGEFKDQVHRPDDTELFTAPWKMVQLIYSPDQTATGDCDDFAIFIAACLKAIGYQARVVLLAVKGTEFDHAAAQVYMEDAGKWIFVDPTNVSNPMGWEIQYNDIMVIE
jgi:transglutaminase-like putative cysteine protease